MYLGKFRIIRFLEFFVAGRGCVYRDRVTQVMGEKNAKKGLLLRSEILHSEAKQNRSIL